MANKKKKEVEITLKGASISLPLIEEKTPFGIYHGIDARNKKFSKVDLIKIANDKNMPVISDYGNIFPEGKTARDFVEIEKQKEKKKA
jgi:hypothetical protein